MCDVVVIEPTGEIAETVGELAALIGGRERLVFPVGAPALGDSDCLCPVDLAATAAAAGFRHTVDFDQNPFGPVWTRPPAGGG